METNKENQDWIFKDGENDIATPDGDMPVMAYTIETEEGNYYDGANILRPLQIKGGKFFTPDKNRFTGIVYAYTPCAIPEFPTDSPLCIFQELNTGAILAAGRFPLRHDSTSVYLHGRSYFIEHCDYGENTFFVDGIVYVTVSDLDQFSKAEREMQVEKVRARTTRSRERSARLFVESKMSEMQILIDARVETMKARRAEVHPSDQTDFDILLLKLSKIFARRVDTLLLKLSKRFTPRSGNANEVMAGRDLFALLTTQLDSDFKVFDSLFTRSARRYERDAWLEQATKEHGELIGIAVAADACGMSIGVYRRQLKRLGVNVFVCPIFWGREGGSSNYLTKKDADRINTEIDKQPFTTND